MSTKIKGNLNVQGDLKLDKETAERAVIIDANNELKSSNVTATELDHVSGVTSSIQDQINSKADATDLADYVPVADKGANNGVATLDAAGKIPASQIPAMAITETFVVADEAAMLALDAQTGDIAIRSDISQTFILQGTDPAELSDWVQLQTPASPVLSVNGEVGAVVLDTDYIAEGVNNLYYTDARAKAAAVADAIVDGVTDVAPSQNAVHDALALKADQATTYTKAETDQEIADAINALPSALIDSVNNTNSVDLSVSSGELTADVKLSAEPVDLGNQEVEIIEETDGLRAQISDANIKAVAVVDSLAGSETDQAPSVDAVNNALATKADASDLADYLPIAGGTLTGPLVLDADPTTDDEAANKKYVDDAISGIPAGANTTLSNLTSPTAINQDILPSADNTRDLGSISLRYSEVHSVTAYVTDHSVRDENSDSMGFVSGRSSAQSVTNFGGIVVNNNTSKTNDIQKRIAISTSSRSSTNNSGRIDIETGNTDDGNSGNISLRPGIPTGTGTRGHIDVTSAQIKNVQDPVADQDAATKKYVDDEIAAIPAGANTTLSNLTSPTAINQDLIPSGNRNLGSNGFRFNTGFFQDLNVGTGYARVQGGNITLPSLLPGNKAIFTSLGSSPIGVYTDNSTNTPSGPIHLETGNTLNSNSGDIILRPGVPTGSGDRGHIDVTSAQIKNVLDPVAAQDAATKNYVDNAISGSVVQGDISLTSFAGANDVQVAADITGFAFEPLEVRSFEALVSVAVDATSELYESFRILGVQRSSGWSLSVVGTGDESLVEFSITPAGQMQYVSGDYAGFVSLDIQFRAIVTHI